jgi:hypothetical protein
MTPRKQIGIPIWSDPILICEVVSNFVFSTLEYNFTSLEYEFEGNDLDFFM